MSRRTAEANRAIAVAWEREQKLVNEGKGTRNWTPNQQKDIIEKGRAYDDDGKVLEGHHMKSVAGFPEHQGNPDNIQFLSRDEHLDAHGGSYQNFTNGYYNPLDRKTLIFIDDKIIPCEIIELSEPIVKKSQCSVVDDNYETKDFQEERNAEIEKTDQNFLINKDSKKSENVKKTYINKKEDVSVFQKIDRVRNSLLCFGRKHPIVTEMIKVTGSTAAAVAIEYGVLALKSSLNAKVKNTISNNYIQTTNVTEKAKVKDIETIADDITVSRNVELASQNVENEKVMRASPIKHSVSGYTQYRNGKEIYVNPYVRGGKSNKQFS